jgi:hypothetical protein
MADAGSGPAVGRGGAGAGCVKERGGEGAMPPAGEALLPVGAVPDGEALALHSTSTGMAVRLVISMGGRGRGVGAEYMRGMRGSPCCSVPSGKVKVSNCARDFRRSICFPCSASCSFKSRWRTSQNDWSHLSILGITQFGSYGIFGMAPRSPTLLSKSVSRGGARRGRRHPPDSPPPSGFSPVSLSSSSNP